MRPTRFQYSGTELSAFQNANNYYRWILHWFVPYLGKRVVEVGAGVGTFSNYLLNGAEVSDLTLVEPADNLFPVLQQRLSRDARVKLVHGYLEDLDSSLSADSVVLVNVLEHIADSHAFLQAVHRILTPGGTLLVLVPALSWLYGSLDTAFSHVRRYSKPVLADELEKAGFRIERLRYFNLFGVATWFLAGKVFRWRALRTAYIRFYDRWVVAGWSRLERHWEPPIGQNLIAIARK